MPKFTLPERRTARAVAPAAFVATPGGTIDIYGEIGPFEGGISAQAVLGQLRAVKDETINIRLNSGGGDVYDGIAIYNDLVAHPARVVVTITGLAASAGSLICMAADEIAMTPGSRMMLHNSWCWGEGNANYFDSLVKELRAIDAAMAEFYAARTGKTVQEIAALMDAETYLGAADAVEQKFADRIEGSVKTLPLAAAEPLASQTSRPEARAQPVAHIHRVKRKAPLAPETVAALEKLADRMERTGHARSVR
jgi:ATP-dependent protease ClpP protease subunit